MGKQVNFFMLPQDERLFLEFVFKEPDVELITSHNNTDNIHIIDKIKYLDGSIVRGSDYYFWKRSFPIEAAWIHEVEFKNPDVDFLGFMPTSRIGYRIDTFTAPIIEYMPSKYLEDGIINRGRIYTQIDSIANATQTKQKNDFVIWYERISRWLRKNYLRTSESEFFYLSPTLVELRKEGKVKYNWLHESYNRTANEILLNGYG